MLYAIDTRMHAHEERQHYTLMCVYCIYNAYCLVCIIAIVCHLTRNDNLVDAKSRCARHQTTSHHITLSGCLRKIQLSTLRNTHQNFMHILNSMSSSVHYSST